MDITQVSFTRKVNCGNFESFDLAATATITPSDDAEVVAQALQTYVDTLCQLRLDAMRRPGARGGKDAGEPWPEL